MKSYLKAKFGNEFEQIRPTKPVKQLHKLRNEDSTMRVLLLRNRNLYLREFERLARAIVSDPPLHASLCVHRIEGDIFPSKIEHLSTDTEGVFQRKYLKLGAPIVG